MAIKDVKRYYYNMLAQYLEMKADLKDFEQAVADGFITEDQLEAARDEVAKVEQNYDRLSYIMYLLEMPNRSEKKGAFKRREATLTEFFSTARADSESVKLENSSALTALREELKKLTKQTINLSTNF